MLPSLREQIDERSAAGLSLNGSALNVEGSRSWPSPPLGWTRSATRVCVVDSVGDSSVLGPPCFQQARPLTDSHVDASPAMYSRGPGDF
jgi:hypothetical protein